MLEENYLDQAYVKQEISEHGYFTQDFEEIKLSVNKIVVN